MIVLIVIVHTYTITIVAIYNFKPYFLLANNIKRYCI